MELGRDWFDDAQRSMLSADCKQTHISHWEAAVNTSVRLSFSAHPWLRGLLLGHVLALNRLGDLSHREQHIAHLPTTGASR